MILKPARDLLPGDIVDTAYFLNRMGEVDTSLCMVQVIGEGDAVEVSLMTEIKMSAGHPIQFRLNIGGGYLMNRRGHSQARVVSAMPRGKYTIDMLLRDRLNRALQIPDLHRESPVTAHVALPSFNLSFVRSAGLDRTFDVWAYRHRRRPDDRAVHLGVVPAASNAEDDHLLTELMTAIPW